MSSSESGEHRLQVVRGNGDTFPVEGSAALRSENRAESVAAEADSWGESGRELVDRMERLERLLVERLPASVSPLKTRVFLTENEAEKKALRINDPERPSPPGPAQPESVACEDPGRVLLLDCFRWLETQRDWSPDTTSQYRQLCSDWSAFWKFRGELEPDIRELSDGFFVPFAEWRGWKERTARKHATNFRTLLKSQMSSAAVSYGRSPADAVLEYVPFDGLRKKRRERSREVAFDRQIQTAKLDAADCSALIRASDSQTWPRFKSKRIGPAAVWAGVWSLAWLYGIRERDLAAIDVRNFDRSDWTLTYLETKTGKLVGPNPVPSWLRPLVQLLIDAAGDEGRSWLFPFPASMRKQKPSNKAFYRHCDEVYSAAGVKPLLRKHGDGFVTDWIHGWRRSCIVAWKRHAPGYQRFITGHKLVGDVSDDHYAAGRVLDDLRDFVETFPRPSALVELNQRLGLSEPELSGMEAGASSDGTNDSVDTESETGRSGENRGTGEGPGCERQGRPDEAAD